jgi:hypothetical protein
VSPAPIEQVALKRLPPIPSELNREIVQDANRYASDLAPKLRKLLAEASFVSGLETFGHALSGRELVHTSYFDHPEILDLLAMHVAWSRGNREALAADTKAHLAIWFQRFKSQLGREDAATGLRIRPRRRRVAA